MTDPDNPPLTAEQLARTFRRQARKGVKVEKPVRLTNHILALRIACLLEDERTFGRLTPTERTALADMNSELYRRVLGVFQGGPFMVCPYCADVIRSCSRHDNAICQCQKVAVDGGRDYTKVSFPDGGKPPTPLHEQKTKTTAKKPRK